MSAKIESLVNGYGETVYPKTKTKAIYDDDGNRLDHILEKSVLMSDHESIEQVDVEIHDATHLDGYSADHYATNVNLNKVKADMESVKNILSQIIGSDVAIGQLASVLLKGEPFELVSRGDCPVEALEDDIVSKWLEINGGYFSISSGATLKNKPNGKGILINFASGNNVFQLYKVVPDGGLYYRSGNISSGWDNNFTKIADINDINKIKPTTERITLLASRWVGENPPYTYNLNIDNNIDVELLLPDGVTVEEFEAICNSRISGNGDNNIIKAWGDKPTIDVPVVIRKVVK